MPSPTTKGPSACLWTCSSGIWCVWALVNASVRNMKANPPTNPATAVSPASSRPSGKRSTNASASSMPAAKAAESDLPPAPNSPPSNARRLAAAKPAPASAARRIALTSTHPRRCAHAPLPASRARAVHLQAVGADLEIATGRGKALQVYRTLLELRNISTPFTDEVVMMVLGELVARATAEIQPPHEPQ